MEINLLEWFGKYFAEKIVKKSDENMKSYSYRYNYRHSLVKYFNYIKREHNIIQIMGMNDPIKITDIYVNLNILEKISASDRKAKDQLEEKYLKDAKFGKYFEEGRNGIDVLTEYNKLFVLGRPGSGKTTFLKYISIQAIEGYFEKIPIFISLRDFSDSNLKLFDYIGRQFEICNIPQSDHFLRTILNMYGYKITANVINVLGEKWKVPNDVLNKIVEIKDIDYTRNDFLIELKKRIGTHEYLSKIKECIKNKKNCIFSLSDNFFNSISNENIPLLIIKIINDEKQYSKKSDILLHYTKKFDSFNSISAIFNNVELSKGKLTKAFFLKLKEEKISTEIIRELTKLKYCKYSKLKDAKQAIKNKIKDLKDYHISLLTEYLGKSIRFFSLNESFISDLSEINFPLDIKNRINEIVNYKYDSIDNFYSILIRKIGEIRYRDIILELSKNPKTVVLFDALDEVRKEKGNREKIIKELLDFIKEYNNCKFVITCRNNAEDYLFEGFTYVEIADFNQRQIFSFIEKWFKDEPTKKENFIHEYKLNLGLKRLRDIANNPLILTLICITFDSTNNFPSRRYEIYEEGFDALLKKWDAKRGIKRDEIYKHLSSDRKIKLFSKIAYETFINGKYLFDQKILQRKILNYLKKLPNFDPNNDIDVESIIKAIEAQHGIFTERSYQIYSFSHLTFHEYFTANYIVKNSYKNTLELLIENHINDDAWQEVILLISEMLDDADYFLNIFFKKTNKILIDDINLKLIFNQIEKETSYFDYKEKKYVLRASILLRMLENSHDFISNKSDNKHGLKELEYTIFNLRKIINKNIYRVVNKVSDILTLLLPIYFPKKNINNILDLFSKIEGNDDVIEIWQPLEVKNNQKIILSNKDKIRIMEKLIPIAIESCLYKRNSFLSESLISLYHYVKAQILLIECIKVASLSNREIYEERFLAPFIN